jgi:hypothetical protein
MAESKKIGQTSGRKKSKPLEKRAETAGPNAREFPFIIPEFKIPANVDPVLKKDIDSIPRILERLDGDPDVRLRRTLYWVKEALADRKLEKDDRFEIKVPLGVGEDAFPTDPYKIAVECVLAPNAKASDPLGRRIERVRVSKVGT